MGSEWLDCGLWTSAASSKSQAWIIKWTVNICSVWDVGITMNDDLRVIWYILNNMMISTRLCGKPSMWNTFNSDNNSRAVVLKWGQLSPYPTPPSPFHQGRNIWRYFWLSQSWECMCWYLGLRSGMLLSFLEFTGESLTTTIWPQMSVGSLSRKSAAAVPTHIIPMLK